MFGNLLKQRKAQATAAVSKFENRDLMEVIVGGSLLVAAADGDGIEDSELIKLEEMIKANEKLAHFGSEIHATIEKFSSQLTTSFRMGKIKVMREMADIDADKDGKEEAFITMLEIAEADGEVDDNEMAILKEVANALGLNLRDFGLA